MNCNTGEISADPRVMEAWREQGDRVLILDAPHESELLNELGAKIVDLDAEAEAARRKETQRFVDRVNAQTGGRPFRRDPVTGLKLRP